MRKIGSEKAKNIGVFLSFLAFSFLTFSILNPVGRSDADETQTVDYTIGAYNLSMAANTEVDAHAIAGYEQKVHSALDYISLSNTCPDGLSVMISSNSETNALVGDNGSEIAATEPGGELSDNSWGFSLDNGSIWNAVPKNDENPIVVYKATTELADPTNFSILYGFKIDRNAVRDGIYSTDVLYTMAPDAGCFIYKVIWDGAGGEVSEDLPTFIDQDELVNLSALPKPIRDYYDFAGWEIDGVTYTGEETAVDINIHNNPIINATALWTPTIYSISYNLNGGSVSDNPTNYNVESEPLSLNNPTRHGYTFKGWSGPDLLGDENKAVVIPTGSHDNRVYIANWTPIDYALTYELNGGAATNPTSYNIESPLITLNNPTKNYYNFKGWSGTDLTGNENTTVKIQTGSTGARSYEANWEPTEYAITYKLRGGSASNPSSYNVETNTFTLNNPSRGQYDFTGWAGTELSGSANKTVTIRRGSNGNRDYDANWQPTNYTISYNLNGGSATNPTIYNVETGEITLNNPTKANYDFVGWSGTDLTGSNNKTVKIPNAAYGDRSYTAHWTPTTYTISYSLKGGSATNPTTYNVESSNFTLNNPTRGQYDFVGWSGTGLSGNNNKTVTINKGSSGNRSYTANWTPTNYTISYNLNGGSATNPTSYNVETGAITLNNPTRTNYDFVGWSGTGLSGNNNKSVTIPAASYGNRSYTANWTPKNYSISYTMNGGSASNPTSYNVETNSFTLNNPTKNHYDFTGWSGTGLTGSANKTVTISKGSSGDRSYTAHFSPTSYSISYTLNGGSATNPTSYTIESNAFTLNNPTRSYYDFTGWSGTGLSGTGNKSVTVPKGSTGARSYTAYWTPTNYSISYNLNGGSATNPTSYNIETNTFILNNPTRANYVFAGWGGTGLSGTGNKSVSVPKGSAGARSYTAYWTAVCTFTSKDFGYTGSVQPWTVPDGCGGTYKFEVWGAQGGNANGNSVHFSPGAGGYAAGTVSLTAGTTVYVVVGGAGGEVYGGYNGGGTSTGEGGGGGGATHIGKQNAVLSSTSSSNVYIVAGGGGGAGASHAGSNVHNGGSGGGTNGGNGEREGGACTYGGSQSGAGNGGGFGYGGSISYSYGGAGGGGGWYGGGGGGNYNGGCGGGGGSGYVGGVTGGTMSNGTQSGHGYAKITKV